MTSLNGGVNNTIKTMLIWGCVAFFLCGCSRRAEFFGFSEPRPQKVLRLDIEGGEDQKLGLGFNLTHALELHGYQITPYPCRYVLKIRYYPSYTLIGTVKRVGYTIFLLDSELNKSVATLRDLEGMTFIPTEMGLDSLSSEIAEYLDEIYKGGGL